MMRRRDFLASAAATCLAPGLAGAQGAWPQRSISLVVPFSAGGSADLVARMFAQHFQAKYGVSVVIENKGGAGGSIGSAKARREQLLTMIPKEAIGPYLAHNSGYDFSKLPARFKLTELNKQIAAANASPVGFVYKLANALGGDPEISREEFFEYGLRTATNYDRTFADTADKLADMLEEEFEAGGSRGGFMMVHPQAVPRDLLNVVDLLVPELQRRGRFRKAYDGKTLKENLLED